MGSEQALSEVVESAKERFGRLRHLVQKFLDDDDVPQECLPLLQECAEIWSSYVDACQDITMQAPKEDANRLSKGFLRLNETAFLYYMIVYTLLEDTLPRLKEFSSNKDQNVRNLYGGENPAFA